MGESSRTHVRIAVIENCSHDLELPASFWMLRSKYNISCAANTTFKACRGYGLLASSPVACLHIPCKVGSNSISSLLYLHEIPLLYLHEIP